jgi:DNA repair ATPase RecN
MSESQWKQIIGKQISEGAYVSQDQLQEAYKRAMPNIDVLNGNGMTKKKVEDLENALAQTESELSATKTRLDQALKRLEDHEGTMSKVIQRLETLESVERKRPEKIKSMD